MMNVKILKKVGLSTTLALTLFMGNTTNGVFAPRNTIVVEAKSSDTLSIPVHFTRSELRHKISDTNKAKSFAMYIAKETFSEMSIPGVTVSMLAYAILDDYEDTLDRYLSKLEDNNKKGITVTTKYKKKDYGVSSGPKWVFSSASFRLD